MREIEGHKIVSDRSKGTIEAETAGRTGGALGRQTTVCYNTDWSFTKSIPQFNNFDFSTTIICKWKNVCKNYTTPCHPHSPGHFTGASNLHILHSIQRWWIMHKGLEKIMNQTWQNFKTVPQHLHWAEVLTAWPKHSVLGKWPLVFG